MPSPCTTFPVSFPRALRLLPLFALAATAPAQVIIQSVTTQAGSLSPTGGTTQDEIDYTFQNQGLAVTGFTDVNGGVYLVSGVADASYTRRNSVNANQSSVWYNRSATNTFRAPHSEDYDSLLLGNNLYRGSDNTFANGTGEPEGNIERLDFVYTSPLDASPALSIAVFERGASTVHDGFKIALITGWDSINNVPSAYSDLFFQAPEWVPAQNVAADFDYSLFRYNAGDNLSDSYKASEVGNQGIGGVVFSIDDFNVTPGTPVYGYSLFGYDVTDGGDSANLLDWTNATYFPTNTDGATGGGGIDLAAVNGVSFTLIPEPSTYALAGVALAFAAIPLRRRPRIPQTAS